jgi:hypothetical protein
MPDDSSEPERRMRASALGAERGPDGVREEHTDPAMGVIE